MMAWWYMGAWPGPPPTTLTPTGDPIPPGGMYFDTDLGHAGVERVELGALGAGRRGGDDGDPVLSRDRRPNPLPARAADRYGHPLRVQPDPQRGPVPLINGVRLEPTVDFTVDTVGSSVTFLRPLPSTRS